jgi:hypothetical protein
MNLTLRTALKTALLAAIATGHLTMTAAASPGVLVVDANEAANTAQATIFDEFMTEIKKVNTILKSFTGLQQLLQNKEKEKQRDIWGNTTPNYREVRTHPAAQTDITKTMNLKLLNADQFTRLQTGIAQNVHTGFTDTQLTKQTAHGLQTAAQNATDANEVFGIWAAAKLEEVQAKNTLNQAINTRALQKAAILEQKRKDRESEQKKAVFTTLSN